ncbi:50S ribosomal protein L6 [Candidatus Roizmanbacteria bacterium]|nr:50S ribosomal protein L6 [Candidatus Roizmanbacteria bacterium]
MSKIGQKHIEVPSAVNVSINQKNVIVKGLEGELTIVLPDKLEAIRQENNLIIKRDGEDKKTKSIHGLYRQLVSNAVTGVQKLWEKRLKVVGTGFSVKLDKEDLVFKVGYSHLVVYKKVPGIKFKVEGNNIAVVLGSDKQLVGEVAYQIKILKKPDVYKGKGIQYEGEKLRIKPGKKAKAAGAPA